MITGSTSPIIHHTLSTSNVSLKALLDKVEQDEITTDDFCEKLITKAGNKEPINSDFYDTLVEKLNCGSITEEVFSDLAIFILTEPSISDNSDVSRNALKNLVIALMNNFVATNDELKQIVEKHANLLSESDQEKLPNEIRTVIDDFAIDNIRHKIQNKRDFDCAIELSQHHSIKLQIILDKVINGKINKNHLHKEFLRKISLNGQIGADFYAALVYKLNSRSITQELFNDVATFILTELSQIPNKTYEAGYRTIYRERIRLRHEVRVAQIYLWKGLPKDKAKELFKTLVNNFVQSQIPLREYEKAVVKARSQPLPLAPSVSSNEVSFTINNERNIISASEEYKDLNTKSVTDSQTTLLSREIETIQWHIICEIDRITNLILSAAPSVPTNTEADSVKILNLFCKHWLNFEVVIEIAESLAHGRCIWECKTSDGRVLVRYPGEVSPHQDNMRKVASEVIHRIRGEEFGPLMYERAKEELSEDIEKYQNMTGKPFDLSTLSVWTYS